LQEKGLVLVQDTDSAYTSHLVVAWIREHKMPVITLPGVSPDLSILESEASTLKRRFHSRRKTTDKAAYAWFLQVFNKEMSQDKVQHMYNYYTKRLHDCLRARGQITKY
jgi:hypothetical protein